MSREAGTWVPELDTHVPLRAIWPRPDLLRIAKHVVN